MLAAVSFTFTFAAFIPWVVIGLVAINLAVMLVTLHSYRWPSVAGRIIDARLEREPNVYVGTSEHAVIRYEYVVAGRRYEGSSVSLGGTFSFSSSASFLNTARPTVEAYAAGSEVDVIYCPLWPRIAFLEGGGRWYLAMMVGIVAAFTSLGWIMSQGRSG